MLTGDGEALRFLVFSAGGFRFGFGAGEVTAIRKHDPTGEQPLAISDLLALEGGPPPPVVMEIRTGGQVRTVAVDRVEALVDIPLGTIRPLPCLLTRHVRPGLWGVAPDKAGMLFLLDFARIFSRSA